MKLLENILVTVFAFAIVVLMFALLYLAFGALLTVAWEVAMVPFGLPSMTLMQGWMIVAALNIGHKVVTL